MMELSALADAASSIEFTDRECYDLLRTQWESSCDQIRLVPLSECSNYSVQCMRCAWQCKARSFYKKHHHDFCALRQFSAARDILVHEPNIQPCATVLGADFQIWVAGLVEECPKTPGPNRPEDGLLLDLLLLVLASGALPFDQLDFVPVQQ